jgi:FeS assembly SUF system protein
MRDDAVETPTPEAPRPQEAPASSPAAAAGVPVPAAANGTAVSDAAVSDELARLTDEIVTAIKTVYDPEIPADVYELGLIYKIDIADDRAVHVEMTLTTPNCPSAQELPIMVENAVASVPGVGPVDVKVVWDPPWDPSRMSDEARVVLNMW